MNNTDDNHTTMNNIDQQSMLRKGTLIHGGVYRVESYLSSGGFGNTYVVRNVEFDEVYALKEFYIKGLCQRDGDSTTISVSNSENAECFTQQREKFKKEARRIRGLHNEHIVKVHDLFEENGTAYYVMDLVDGESLKDRLHRTNKPLPEAEVNKLLPQILDGLKAIHDMHIWHLDIKPANIMVDKHGTVKLIDFGASKQQNSAICYTMGYAPSEQMAQEYEEFGPWTDFYALGATLYKLLTLQNPPSVTKVSEDESEDKHEALPMPGVSDKTRRLIAWMMQDKRKRRPQSAEEILKWLAGEDDTTIVVEPTEDNSDTIVISKPKQPNIHLKPVDRKPKAPEDNTVKEKEHPMQDHSDGMGSNSSNGTDDEAPAGDDNDNKWERVRNVLCVLLPIVVIVGICAFWKCSKNGNGQEEIGQEEIQQPDSTEISFNNGVLTYKGIKYEMIKVEADTFTMGATPEMGEAGNGEEPRLVSLVNNYYMGKTEVTQALWTAVMGDNPSSFKGDNKPVEQVSYIDCQKFIATLNAATGKEFRLPTEAEWEFAARGGNNSRHYQYSGSNTIDDVAWYKDNSGNETHEVATKQPNELGLYDMAGNVYEWCNDDEDSAPPIRGGCWCHPAQYCRSCSCGLNLCTYSGAYPFNIPGLQSAAERAEKASF